jgi:hypothetical protein
MTIHLANNAAFLIIFTSVVLSFALGSIKDELKRIADLYEVEQGLMTKEDYMNKWHKKKE